MALVLAPELPLGDWLQALDAQIARSPSFFDGRPVIVDLGSFPPDSQGVAEFLALLQAKGIHIIGTEGAHPSWEGVERWGRPMPAGRSPGRPVEIPPEPPAASQANATSPVTPAPVTAAADGSSPDPTVEHAPVEPATLVVDHPIRSGQSIVFERGDLTILGSVASGAEVMAGGSVHIYGTLRGRAVAGLAGNAKARIFCRNLQAELVAIDGVYQTADDMPQAVIGKAAQAFLDGEHMRITTLD